jgi:RNA polymerase sigma factor (sigma-70 family)
MKLSDDFFRQESGRLVAALTKIFGVHNLQLAEEVVQDSFCRAIEIWQFRGIPENPSAWLMTTAKNRALDVLRRDRTARTFAPELGRLLESEWTLTPLVEDLFNESAIKDDLLRMMFSCCHPNLAEEGHVALILNILCGFGVDEIAQAFMSSHAAIEKRITRAKHVLSTSKKLFDVTIVEDVAERLPSVHRALYLLFNEGYHGSSQETSVRGELCREAMRLSAILLSYQSSATPVTYALSALMCLHAARLPGRVDSTGNLASLFDQDRAKWDQELLADGMRLLELSATGSELSEYHIESAIASIHATAPSVEETKWETIVELYNSLLRLRPSPVIALNRAIALAQSEGPARGLEEIQSIPNRERLQSYPFYFAAQGEFELSRGKHKAALMQFQIARSLARNTMERQFYDTRVKICKAGDPN